MPRRTSKSSEVLESRDSQYEDMDAPKYQGSLEKQGRVKTWTWKKYWFMLKEDQLSYVKNQEKGAYAGNIDMSQAQFVRIISGNHGLPFEIVTKTRTHILSASSSEQRDKWIKMLHDGMKWKGSRSSSIGSSIGSSIRASCNSIGEEEGYSTVFDAIKSTPSNTSSGYSSASSRASGVQTRDSRSSGTEDLMYNNPSYSKQPVKKIQKSQADDFVRNSGRSILEADGGRESSQVVYEDIDDKRGSQHKGLRRLIPLRSPSEETKARISEQFRESTKSDASGFYDEVVDPVAGLAISHIVKGYANIRRNPGPHGDAKPVMPSQIPDSEEEEEEDDYDEVFTPSQRGSKVSSVVMRKSVQNQNAEETYEYADTNSVIMRNSSRGQSRGETDSELYDSTGPPNTDNTTSQRTSAKRSHPKSFRKSMLPAEIEDYFNFNPIPELEHPRRELTHRTAFDDIRQFLANNRGPDEVYTPARTKKKNGAAIKRLRDFLTLNSG